MHTARVVLCSGQDPSGAGDVLFGLAEAAGHKALDKLAWRMASASRKDRCGCSKQSLLLLSLLHTEI